MKLNQYEWDPENDLIAEGAFAEVFKAHDTNARNRQVALKIYKEAVSRGTSTSSGNRKYSLEKEFQNVDGLSHSNIISYYGLDYIKHTDAMGRSSSYAVLIMEYANKGTLTDLMRINPNESLVDKIIVDILHGVRYLHSEGIIHRDLKPGNILITKNRKGEPIAKITDFGISRDTFSNEALEQSMTEGVGTPHYMAPEQVYKKKFGLNGEISNRTDIWAVGVIVYRILTSKLPFGYGSKDFEHVWDSIANDSPDYSNIPRKYIKFLEACLRKDAASRPQNIDELIQFIGANDIEKTISKNSINEIYEKTIFQSVNFFDENKKTVYQDKLSSSNEDITIEKGTRATRAFAWVIDFITGILIFALILFLYSFFFKRSIDGEHALLIILLIAYLILYYVLPEIKYGKTLGNHVLGLRLINTNKRKIKKSNIIIRNLIKVFTIFGIIPLLIIQMNYELFLFKDNQSLPHTLSVSYFWLLCFIAIVTFIFNKSLHNHFATLIVIKNKKGKVNLESDNFKIKIKPEGKKERILKYSVSGLLLLATLFLIRIAFYENYIFTNIYHAKEGNHLRMAKMGNKYGFISNDFRYKTVVPFKFDSAHGFGDGLALVELKDKKYFIDETGWIVFPAKFDDIYDFSEGLAGVKLYGKWGFIDKKGKVVIPFEYSSVRRFSEGLAGVLVDGKWGFINKEGEMAISLKKYESEFFTTTVGNFSGGLVRVKLDDKWGFTDKKGEMVIPLKYDEAYDFENGKAKVKLDGKWFMIDKKGNFIEE